jgi:hypothetical protein
LTDKPEVILRQLLKSRLCGKLPLWASRRVEFTEIPVFQTLRYACWLPTDGVSHYHFRIGDHPTISFTSARCGVESEGAMTAKFKIGLRIALILTVVFGGIVAHGQAAQPTRNNDALAVSQIMQTEQIQVGQMPWAILTVCNISDQPVTTRDTRYRVYVYGKDGEAPTTLVQRQFTDRLRPGDVPLLHGPDVGPSTWPAGGVW